MLFSPHDTQALTVHNFNRYNNNEGVSQVHNYCKLLKYKMLPLDNKGKLCNIILVIVHTFIVLLNDFNDHSSTAQMAKSQI